MSVGEIKIKVVLAYEYVVVVVGEEVRGKPEQRIYVVVFHFFYFYFFGEIWGKMKKWWEDLKIGMRRRNECVCVVDVGKKVYLCGEMTSD